MRPARPDARERFSTELSPDFGDSRALYLVARPRQVKAGRASISGSVGSGEKLSVLKASFAVVEPLPLLLSMMRACAVQRCRQSGSPPHVASGSVSPAVLSANSAPSSTSVESG